VGHRSGLSDRHLVHGVVLVTERGRDGVVAVAFRRRGVLLAVALREIDLPLLTGHDLDDAVRDVLLVVGRDALAASLVVEDQRAVLLDLVLLRERRFLVGIDVLGRDVLGRVLVFLQPVL